MKIATWPELIVHRSPFYWIRFLNGKKLWKLLKVGLRRSRGEIKYWGRRLIWRLVNRRKLLDSWRLIYIWGWKGLRNRLIMFKGSWRKALIVLTGIKNILRISVPKLCSLKRKLSSVGKLSINLEMRMYIKM